MAQATIIMDAEARQEKARLLKSYLEDLEGVQNRHSRNLEISDQTQLEITIEIARRRHNSVLAPFRGR